jgi:hypothetical protein
MFWKANAKGEVVVTGGGGPGSSLWDFFFTTSVECPPWRPGGASRENKAS